MKNKSSLLFSLLIVLLTSSCVSAKATTYSDIPDDYKSVYIILDSSKTTVASEGYFYYSYDTFSYIPGYSSDAMLDTVKNRVLIQTTLEGKGYIIVSNIDDADMILMGGYTTNELYTDVILAFYDKESNKVLFTSEGRYGIGLDLQGDVNGAVKKALESVPEKAVENKE